MELWIHMHVIISLIQCIVLPVCIVRHLKRLAIRLGILKISGPMLHQLLFMWIGQNQPGMMQNLGLKLTGQINSRLTVLHKHSIFKGMVDLSGKGKPQVSDISLINNFGIILTWKVLFNIDSSFVLSHQHLKLSSKAKVFMDRCHENYVMCLKYMIPCICSMQWVFEFSCMILKPRMCMSLVILHAQESQIIYACVWNVSMYLNCMHVYGTKCPTII